MVVYISLGNLVMALLNYEKGADNIEVELLASSLDKEKLAFPLDELITALQQSKELLQRCAKEDKER